MGVCRLLRVSSLRKQLAFTVIAFFGFSVRLLAMADEGGGLTASSLLTWQNVFAACVLVYHFGMVRAQFISLQDRVKKLEDERDQDLKARLSLLGRRVEELEGRPR